ncbi:helix-turn-helix domain-containing protein [Bifidobacterium cuniculi]|uniref:helix-turn-helix domain-containing protein n=1 Tax=Bifidobacterium cuniculi TaxID=1688 RepID=UPI0009DFCDD5|nr:helix-turn-helix transcriptional regulator [Bifidobacterium cuniculi]
MGKKDSTRDDEIIANYLRDLRMTRHISQQELAESLGEPQSFVSKYENAQRKITAATFLRIVVALGVTPAAAAQAVSRKLGI